MTQMLDPPPSPSSGDPARRRATIASDSGKARTARTEASPRPGTRPRRRWFKRLLLAVVACALGGALVLGALVTVSPSASDAPARVRALLAAHGAPSDGGGVPTRVGAALLATEDSRYYHDPALDPLGVVRAVKGVVTADKTTGGATIEVQLAKLLYTPGRSGPLAVLEQVGIAFNLDRHFSKTEILAMYLDAAYFGDGAYGITAAAMHYFGVAPGQLSWAQASLLAGLVQAPSAYDPHGHLSTALLRRHHVLVRMVASGVLTAAQARRVAAESLHPAVPFTG